jgi:hypothetical protein
MKYTESDYKRTHQSIIEDMIDTCISKWHDQSHDPLEARVCRNLAYALEDLRHAQDCLVKGSLNIWVSAANEEANRKNTPKGVAK